MNCTIESVILQVFVCVKVIVKEVIGTVLTLVPLMYQTPLAYSPLPFL